METPNYKWKNWFGNLTSSFDYYQPGNLAELQAAVRRAAGKGNIRAVGGSYAWSPLVPVTGSGISLDRLSGPPTVDLSGARPTVRVECGWSIRKLVEFTRSQGLTLITPPIFQDMSLGGALAVGAHGTGLEWSTMSDTIVSMRLVDAQGNLVELSAQDGERFDAAKLALGTFGIVHDVTLACERAFNLHVEDRFKPRDEVLAGIDDLLKTSEFVELYWFPFNERMWLKLMDRTPEPVAPDSWRERLDGWWDFWTSMVSVQYVLPWVARRLPRLTPWFMQLAPDIATTPGVDVEPASEEFHYQRAYPRCWDMSWAVPIADSARAWRAIMQLVDDFAGRGKYPVNMVAHSRFIGGSSALLAPAWGGPVCDIEVTTAKGTPGTDDFFLAFTDAMLAFPGARPHWGKYLLRPEALRARYPKMNAFLGHRQAMDPGGVFLNDFLARDVFNI